MTQIVVRPGAKTTTRLRHRHGREFTFHRGTFWFLLMASPWWLGVSIRWRRTQLLHADIGQVTPDPTGIRNYGEDIYVP